MRFFHLLVLFLMPLLYANATDDITKHRILFLVQGGDLTNAITLYKQHIQGTKHDFELLQQIALLLLEQGCKSADADIQLLTYFGAGIAANEQTLHILEEGLLSPSPEHQLVCLNFLGRFQHDDAEEAMNIAMRSNHLIIRLEAAYLMCEKKSRSALGQTESLMAKLPKELYPLFPQFFAMIGDVPSTKALRRFLSNPDDAVRVQAILACAKQGRDDLLPSIRTLASHHNIAQQEACAYALGILKDSHSIERLQTLAHSPTVAVRLAALQALYKLGQKEAQTEIERLAKQHDLYAINILGEIEGSEEILYALSKESNIQVRMNAGLSLLMRKDSRCIPILIELLIKDARDIALVKTFSHGGGLSFWKAVPSANQNFKENPLLIEVALSARESIITDALNLNEKDFIYLASTLFNASQNDLVPVVVSLLKQLHTHAAIEFLKRYQQKTGAPLIRNYCTLALFQMKEPGPWSDLLRLWIARQSETELIRFRPFTPLEMRESSSKFQLTQQETSRLLVEAYESFAQLQNDIGVEVLLDALVSGNSKNRYAVAGLLMRAAQ